MRRRKASNGPSFPFLPVPKNLGTAVSKPVAQKAPAAALIKVSPSELKSIGESHDDRLSYQIYQKGQGMVDQKAFHIQQTKDGWRACAMWSVEGKGEIPNFVKKLSCNLDIFNDVFNLGMRLKPEIKTETVNGGLFALERAEGDPVGDMIRRLIGTLHNNIGHFPSEEDYVEHIEIEYIEEDMP